MVVLMDLRHWNNVRYGDGGEVDVTIGKPVEYMTNCTYTRASLTEANRKERLGIQEIRTGSLLDRRLPICM